MKKKILSGLLALTTVFGVAPAVATALAETEDPSYTITVTTDQTDGKVYPDETLTVYLTVTGNANGFYGANARLTYDTNLLTHTKTDGMDDDENDGSLFYQEMAITTEASYLLVSYTFVAKEVVHTTDNIFGVSGEVCPTADAALSDVNVTVNGVGVTVSVVKTYGVTFTDENGNKTIYTVDEGATQPAPTISGREEAYYTWTASGENYTSAELLTLPVTADAFYVYNPNEYDVASHSELTAPTSASYGSDFTVSLNDYDKKYDYTITYTAEGQSAITATLDEAGAFVVDGLDVKGDISFNVEKTLNVEISTYADYVRGFRLVLIDGNAAGYTYDGAETYAVARYGGQRAWIVEGALTSAQAEEKIRVSNVASVVLEETYDVNKDHTSAQGEVINLNDAVTVYACSTGQTYAVDAAHMNVYLRSDVDGNKKVEMWDYNLVTARLAQANN